MPRPTARTSYRPLALARGFRIWAWLHVLVLIVAGVAVLMLLRDADAPTH